MIWDRQRTVNINLTTWTSSGRIYYKRPNVHVMELGPYIDIEILSENISFHILLNI